MNTDVACCALEPSFTLFTVFRWSAMRVNLTL